MLFVVSAFAAIARGESLSREWEQIFARTLRHYIAAIFGVTCAEIM